MKTKYKLMLSGATTACLFLSLPAFAQDADAPAAAEDDAVARMSTVTVEARKRDEALSDVPVSISVLNNELIQDAGIITQQDLFELVPGIYYDESFDRNSALPSVRGVQANETATLRTKVTQFIDGMPVLGSQGNAPFGDAAQVEVYRGPQSAAFGRSTFGGAINYVTKDPGDEFEASASVDINDYGRFIYGGNVSGPITDQLGFLLSANFEDTSGPDEFIATDGTAYGERTSEAYAAKLVWNPTPKFEAKATYTYVESDDGPSAEIFITQESRDACFADSGSFVLAAMGGSPYGIGEIDCDWDYGGQIRAQNDRTALILANGPRPGETDAQFEERLFIAAAQSLPADEVGTYDERDRFSLNLSYDFDNGHSIELLGFVGEEFYIRGNDGDGNDIDEFQIDAATSMPGDPPPAFPWEVATGMGVAVGTIMSDPTDIEEEYAEIRWVSPAENRLRYVVGASYYDYSFVTNLFFGGYGAILQGQDAVDRYETLTGVYLGDPTVVFSEQATNTGAFFNVSYDFTEKLTATVEGRFQVDDVSGTDTVSGLGGSKTTEAFLPRLSANYDVSDNLTMYGQIAIGNNPSGVNVAFFNPDYIDNLDCAAGTIGPNGAECGQTFVDYTSSDLAFFEEEKLTNYEIGLKGSAFDNKLDFSAAAYFIDWKDQVQSVNLSWADSTLPPNQTADFTGNRTSVNLGDVESKGVEFEGTYRFTDAFSVRGTAAFMSAKYKDLCDFTIATTGYDAIDGVDVTSGEFGACIDVSGKELSNQPNFTGSLSPSYRTPLGNSGFDVNLRGDVRYEAESQLDSVNVAQKPALMTINVTAGISNENWSITGYINNLTDEDTPSRFSGGDDYGITDITVPELDILNYQYRPRQPRTLGLRLRYTY